LLSSLWSRVFGCRLRHNHPRLKLEAAADGGYGFRKCRGSLYIVRPPSTRPAPRSSSVNPEQANEGARRGGKRDEASVAGPAEAAVSLSRPLPETGGRRAPVAGAGRGDDADAAGRGPAHDRPRLHQLRL